MPSRLPKRGSTYYFRRAVPEPLRPYFLTESGKPRTEFMESLGTKDFAEAKELDRKRGVEVDALLREARAKLAKGIPPDHVRVAVAATQAWDPVPNRDELEHFEEVTRAQVQDDLAEEYELEADPDKRRRADAVQAALARREAQEREMLDFIREGQSIKRAPLMQQFDA